MSRCSSTAHRLRASRIVYDQASDRLVIDGPIVLTDETGDTIILASQADLSADLSEGILTSARLVLNQQLQLAANRMMRTGGRYTALDSVVASSCKVCAANPVPLWEIRARRVVHDQQERQLYFDHAQFRVCRRAGVLHPAPAHARPDAGPRHRLSDALAAHHLGPRDRAEVSLFHHPWPQSRPD